MTETDCIFCKIAAGEVSSDRVYKDDRVTAFRDINPAAPVHILIVPNRHIASVNELEAEDRDLAGHLLLTARKLAEQEGIARDGYRLILNTGRHGGQEVHHLHLHLLGGRRMQHPMG